MIIPVFRSPHPPAHTACGVANGVFWGLTPTVGLQTIEIVATWWVARTVFRRDSSLLQAMLWVWVNNPLTMLPMYYVFFVTGLSLTGTSVPVDYDSFTVGAIGLPVLVGCIPYAVTGSVVSYWWALRLTQRRRQRLAARRLKYETFRTSDPSG